MSFMFLLKICLQKSDLSYICTTCTSNRELSTSKVTFAVHRKECFMETKIKYEHFEAENFTSIYKKGVGALDELHRTSKIRRISKIKS